MANKTECDATVVVGALIVFALPLTLLIPDFSIWDVIPKVRVTRFHILSESLTWPQSNAVLVALLSLFFCLYLEIRKRKTSRVIIIAWHRLQYKTVMLLDDMVERVLTVGQANDATMDVERERQTAAMKVCVELLDSATEHYEHLMLLRDELHRREPPICQLPPVIEPSGSNI